MSALKSQPGGSGRYQPNLGNAKDEAKRLREVVEGVNWLAESLGQFRVFCNNNSNKAWLDDLQFLAYCSYSNGMAALAGGNGNTARAMISNLYLLARCTESVIRDPKKADLEWMNPLLDLRAQSGVLHVAAVDQEPYRQAIERLAATSPAFRDLMGEFFIVQSQGSVAKAAL